MVRFRPEDYPNLSPHEIYYLIEERSLTEARLAYNKAYGRSCTDKGIDAEIDMLFRDWFRDWDQNDNSVLAPTIEVPPHLLLGLLLREGSGRDRGRLRMTVRQRLERYKKVELAYGHFKKLRAAWKDAMIAAGCEKSYAEAEARDEALEAVSKWYGLPKDTILRPDRKRRRRRSLKRA
jgi:hypothetical protein